MDATTTGKLGLDVAAANQGQLRLAIAGVNTDDVTFLKFNSQGHGLSQDYRFNFTLELKTVLDLSQVIGAAAYFEVSDNSEPVYIHGIIAEATYLGSRADGESYYISMNSMLFPLRHNLQNKVFLNKDVKQIVTDVLEASKFNNAEFEFKTKNEYPIREFTVQYNESDFDFIARLLAYEGIFYSFEQTADGAKIVFYDNISDVPAFESGELMYETQTGSVRALQTIYSLNRHSQMLTDNVKFKDYNYRTPEASLEAATSRSSSVSGQGTDYRYGENYKTLDDGDRIAKLRQQALDWPRETYIAETDCRALIPGQKFTLINHPNAALNGDYYIVCIAHQGDQSAAQPIGARIDGIIYKNTLTLVKAGIPYRASLPEPRYQHGVFSAKVETTGGDYAYLDEQGRYRIRMPFDLSARPDGEASHSVRQAQTHSGMEYGMHFPLQAGTEVILTCVNGDLDRPIMLAALHNPDLPNLVTADNHSQNLLRSWGDNELLMEDRKGEERIDLFTRERKNSLRLDAKSGKHKVYLGSDEGEMEQYAAKTMLIESGDSQTVQSGNDHILTIENAHSLHTEKKQIEYKAKTDIRYKAGKNIFLRSETKNIEMQVGKDMVVDVNNNLSLEVRNKDLSIVCKSGNFEIKAARAMTVKGQGGGNITVSQAGGSVVIDTGGAITIAGNTVNIDGDSVFLKGETGKQGGGGSGRGASGSQNGTDISKLNLAMLDVFTHSARKAQDLAASINAATVKEQINSEDVTVDQVAAQQSSNPSSTSTNLTSAAAALAANKTNPGENSEPGKRVYGLAWSKDRAPVGIPVDLTFSVQGFAGGETAEIQVIETAVDGGKKVIDTIQTPLTSGSGGQVAQWDTRPQSSVKASETQGQLNTNKYAFQCTVAGVSSNEISSPLCLTTNLKVQIESQGDNKATVDKVSIKAGDGKTYTGYVQNNEATVRNVPIGNTEKPKIAVKQTGYLLSSAAAPLPSTGEVITSIGNLPKEIHGGGWEPANQENYQGSKQDKPNAFNKFWALTRAASIVLGVIVVDDTHEPVARWEANGYGYKYDMPSGLLFVYQGGQQIAEYRVHNNNYGEVQLAGNQKIVATIDEYGNVTPIQNQILAPEEQEQLNYRTYVANGGEGSFSVWKGSGMPLEVGGEKVSGDVNKKLNTGTKVPYGSTDLSKSTIDWRKKQNYWGGSNIAAASYKDLNGEVQTIVKRSNLGGKHSERLLIEELESNNIPLENVNEIYSELEPCDVPGGKCAKMLNEKVPNAKLTYSFDYPGQSSASRELRIQGLNERAEALSKVKGE